MTFTLPKWPPDWPEIRASLESSWQTGDWGRYHADAPRRLSQALSERLGVGNVRLMPSGSAGIEWSLRAIGIGPGDAVVLSALDYPGNFRAVELCGGRPILVDTLAGTPKPDLNQILSLQRNDIRAVIVSHLYGIAACGTDFRGECESRGWTLIEDACQVPGMKIDGCHAGSIGDIGVWSFGGSKPLTAGSGGAIMTSNARIAARLSAFLDRPGESQALSPMQAAVLVPQLQQLDRWCAVRAATAESLRQTLCSDEALSNVRIVPPDERTVPSHYKAAIHFDSKARRDAFLARASEAELPAGESFRVSRRQRRGRFEMPFETKNAADFVDRVSLLDHRALMVGEDRRRELVTRLVTAMKESES